MTLRLSFGTEPNLLIHLLLPPPGYLLAIVITDDQAHIVVAVAL
jgi:hypothetical protein